jgi:Endonuclease/Exonuclease/phosphatase family.
MKQKSLNATITCTHVPTKENDAFNDHLEWLHLKAQKHNTNIVMGDFNANHNHVPSSNEHGFAPNIRKHILHKEKNNNGNRIIDFAVTRSMIVAHCFSIKVFIYKHGNHQIIIC